MSLCSGLHALRPLQGKGGLQYTGKDLEAVTEYFFRGLPGDGLMNYNEFISTVASMATLATVRSA
jgi:hypothetical protein